MESNQQIVQSIVQKNKLATSNVFSKSVHSRLYESFHLQNSTLTQDKLYDSQYRGGFPKLYSFDTSVQNRSRLSQDDKNKYSFRDSKVGEENSALNQQNLFLRNEVNRLNNLLQNQRATMVSRAQYDRLADAIRLKQAEIARLKELLEVERRSRGNQDELNRLRLQFSQSEAEIRRLQSIVQSLQNRPPQSNEWQLKFSQSQTTINQLNITINGLNQQLSQYQSEISQYKLRISQLESQPQSAKVDPQVDILKGRWEQSQLQIKELTLKIQQYQTQISKYSKYQLTIAQYQTKIAQYQTKISQYQSQITKYESQITQYETRFTQYETQITTLQQLNWKIQQKYQNKPAPVVPAGDNSSFIVEEGRLNLRVIILLQEINRLRQKEDQLNIKAEQLHAYLLKAENYIEEIQKELEQNNIKQNIPSHIVEKITRLQQENNKYTVLIQELQARMSNDQNTGIPEEIHVGLIGQKSLRIIILLEEINRLSQKILQIRSYLEKAEDYIEQLQQTIQNQETVIPPEVENQINYLSEENNRLNAIIENYIVEIKNLKISITQLQTRTNISTTVVNHTQISPEIQAKIAFLAQQNERLNSLVIELQNRPTRVQTKIQYRSNEQLEKQYARLQLKSIVLLEEINRLNKAVQEVTSFLETAENYIFELETKMKGVRQSHTETTRVDTITQYKIPEEIEKQLAKFTLKTIFLLEEINRLNNAVREIQSHLITAQNYISECETRISQYTYQNTTQYQIPPELEENLAFLNQQNERLNRFIIELQNRPARVETKIQHTVQFKVSPQIQARIALLVSENQRLKFEINNHRSTGTVERDDSLVVQYGKLQLKSIVLLEEINRLKTQNQQVRQYLKNAEQYIFQLESRPAQVGSISPEIQSQLLFLTQQNQRLVSQINKITITYEQQINHYKTEITNYTTQITNYKTEINNYTLQITNLQSKSITTTQIPHEIQVKIAFLTTQNQRLSKLADQTYSEELIASASVKWGQQKLRAIILLEEINRLNYKLEEVDAERVQVITHLRNAETFIEDISSRYAALQNQKQSSISNVTVEGSTTAIHQLSTQIIELESQSKVQIGRRDLRIVFLLQQINRLNNKEKQLISSLGGSSKGISSSQEIMDLRREKDEYQRELEQVLGHLRQAEEYIGELSRQNQAFAEERDQLIGQLNNLQHPR